MSEPKKKQHVGSIDIVAQHHGFDVFVHDTDNLLGKVTLEDERLKGHPVFIPCEGKLLLADWLSDISIAIEDIKEAQAAKKDPA
jgi:hypothetical protein